MALPDFDALPLDALARRSSVKWRLHPPDVLPLWVAELDVPLPEPVTAALRAAVDAGDTGYAEPSGLAAAFAGFAARRWGWHVEVERCRPVADVMTGVAEALAVLTRPGDGVVVCPPVYPPFHRVAESRDRVTVPVPLGPDGDLDLLSIAGALRDGARAVLLCSPHNPTGRVWTASELDALDDVVRAAGAVVVADEIWAPLVLPGAQFVPHLQGRDRAAVAVVSASKAYNLAGLKAALLVAGSAETQARLAQVPVEVAHRLGHFGVLAAVAAWSDGDGWLDALLRHLDRNRALLADLLTDQLPAVRYDPPQAGYLAWLDCRSGGPRPAARFLEGGRVALMEGSDFGPGGSGYVRLNFGTTKDVLVEAVRRMATVT